MDKRRKPYLKFLSLSFVFMFMLLQVLPVFANNDNVIDEADLFSDNEENMLQDQISDIINTHDLELVIVTITDAQGKSSMAYADDYFDYNGFGIGSENDGILLLINMEIRELWISTTGSSVISKYQYLIDPILDEFTPNISNGDYYKGAKRFLEVIDTVETTGKVETFSQRLVSMITSWIPWVVALGVGAVVTAGLTFSGKSKMTAGGRNYEASNSFTLSSKIDRFEHEHTTRRRIPKNNSSGGSGGSHTGSSGTSHGGGGRGF